VILELGSGSGTTQELSKTYQLHSVEHDKEWLHKYRSHYIHAPLINGWYDPAIHEQLPRLYNLLIIDGPPGKDRVNVIRHFNMFLLYVPVLIDDTERPGEKEIIKHLIGLGYFVIGEDKRFPAKQWTALSRKALFDGSGTAQETQ
jgi:hypothetical protein